jgi:hypothetical protein
MEQVLCDEGGAGRKEQADEAETSYILQELARSPKAKRKANSLFCGGQRITTISRIRTKNGV